jgi:hypothetical protein
VFGKLSRQLRLYRKLRVLQQTLTQQISANNSNWPSGDKLYVEFNVLKQTLAQQTSANFCLVVTMFD